MNSIQLETICLIGLSQKHQTINANGQSAIDCGNLWQQFLHNNHTSRIPGKLNENIFAVYHNYMGDHTQPYSFFIGCQVDATAVAPDGLDRLVIPTGGYLQIAAAGKMPDCVADAWQQIWKSDIKRAYRPDFEIYDERSQDWQNAQVMIYLSV
jgi:predicted transcriptional regulator YdeE